MKHLYSLFFVALCATTIASAQNVGIGTNIPDEKLDVDGNVKIRGGELSTSSIADIVPFYVRGSGVNNNTNRVFIIGSTVVYNAAGRGLQLTIINKSDYSVVSNTSYDTYGFTAQSDALATAINSLTSGQIGIITSYDAWEGAVTTNLDNAFKAHGLTKAFAANNNGATHRKPYAAMFEGGSGVNTAKSVEVLIPSNSTAPYAEIRGWFIAGSFVAAPSLPNAMMNVDGSNIGLYVDESSNINANGNPVTNLPAPTNGSDATNKTYVDGLIGTVTASDDWDLSGVSLYPKNTSYNIGLGNSNPGAYKLNVTGNTYMSGNLLISQSNTTGGGLKLADDGDIVDLNDGFATHRFSYGLRLTNANSGGSTVVQLSNGVAGSGHTYFNTSNNFGIGNNNPLAKLHVSGTSRFEGNMDVTSGNVTVSSLAGSGDRHVYVNSGGTLVTSATNSDWIISANLRHSPDDWCDGCTNVNNNIFSDGTDDARHVANLGFSIVINGVTYTQVTICTNGWMAFGDVNSTSLANTTLPTTTFSGPVVFPYWDDLKDFGSGEFIRYGTVGTAGNRVFISDWQMRTFSGSGVVNFQVLVHEGSGLIVVQYENEMNPASNGQSATVGFQVSNSKGYPIVTNGKIFDDNEDSQMSWSVCPVR